MNRELSLLIISLYLVGCAGPTTPFGSIDTLTPDFRSSESSRPIIETDNSNSMAAISFEPKRQVLHLNKPFNIKIAGVYSKSPERHIKLLYNDIDVTKKFLAQAKTSIENHIYTLKFSKLILPTKINNKILISYKEPTQAAQVAQFMPPTCSIYDMQHVYNTKPFNAPQEYIDIIEKLAPKSNMNPSLISALIAQESGFNRHSVSWAKAIGLTQVTPIAEEEIISMHKDFPRYPNLNNYSYAAIKAMIISGHLNSNKEWRLNPEHSIKGGIAYLKYIDKYWRKPQNTSVASTLSGDPYLNYSRILLASYNSGSSRVKYAIQRKNQSWLQDSKLKEARKYVNNVLSYCYHFSQNNKPNKGAKL